MEKSTGTTFRTERLVAHSNITPSDHAKCTGQRGVRDLENARIPEANKPGHELRHQCTFARYDLAADNSIQSGTNMAAVVLQPGQVRDTAYNTMKEQYGDIIREATRGFAPDNSTMTNRFETHIDRYRKIVEDYIFNEFGLLPDLQNNTIDDILSFKEVNLDDACDFEKDPNKWILRRLRSYASIKYRDVIDVSHGIDIFTKKIDLNIADIISNFSVDECSYNYDYLNYKLHFIFNEPDTDTGPFNYLFKLLAEEQRGEASGVIPNPSFRVLSAFFDEYQEYRQTWSMDELMMRGADVKQCLDKLHEEDFGDGRLSAT